MDEGDVGERLLTRLLTDAGKPACSAAASCRTRALPPLTLWRCLHEARSEVQPNPHTEPVKTLQNVMTCKLCRFNVYVSLIFPKRAAEAFSNGETEKKTAPSKRQLAWKHSNIRIIKAKKIRCQIQKLSQ